MPILQMREVSAVGERSVTFSGSYSSAGRPGFSDSTSSDPDMSKCKYLSSFLMETCQGFPFILQRFMAEAGAGVEAVGLFFKNLRGLE